MVIMPVILLLLLLSIVFGVKLFQDMICWNREKSSCIILEKQVSSLQEHMGEMERVYSGIRGMRHDMKNTISVIMQLAAGEEQAAKKKRREEYARLNEESALKRRLMEQETDDRYYKDSMTKKAVSIAAYEAAGILK